MPHDLSDTIALLARTPAALDAFLRGLPDTWIRSGEGPRTWTAIDIVGHLVHAEHTDWIPRTQMILRFGDTRPFERFDRTAHDDIIRDKSIGQLLDDSAQARSASLHILKALDLKPHPLALQGRHPELGAVTLSELLSTLAAHDLTHIHQLSRVMAHQYRAAVGPWTVYLGVLQCAGHSVPALTNIPSR